MRGSHHAIILPSSEIHFLVPTVAIKLELSTTAQCTRKQYKMVFTTPPSVPKLPFDPPDSIPICDFMLDEQYGRYALSDSRPPFTCGLTGVEYSAPEVKERVEKLARALSRELGWEPNKGTEWDKVAGVFSVNTVCLIMLRMTRRHIDRTLYRLILSLYLGLYVMRFPNDQRQRRS